MARSRAELLADLAALIDEAMEAGADALIADLQSKAQRIRPQPRQQQAAAPPRNGGHSMSPQKRGAQTRAGHGVIKDAVRVAIYANRDGISRPRIVRYALEELGVTVKDGSLKNAIRILKADGDIRNAKGEWFPTRDA